MLDILLDVHIDLLVALVLLKELSQLLSSGRCNPEITNKMSATCEWNQPAPINLGRESPILRLVQREGLLGSLAWASRGLEDSSHPGIGFGAFMMQS